MPAPTCRLFVRLLLLVFLSAGVVAAAEPSLSSADVGRTKDLPAELRLLWSRSLPKLRPAWPDQPKLQFDAAYAPVMAADKVFVSSSYDDSVTAYDETTGDEVWRFFADGPVRFAPLVWKDKLYAVSDDGYLYCLRSDNGQLLWRFRGGPSDRKVLGNERLISAWPARGAPAIADGTVYFAAGIWPFMGVFIHALNAETGAVVWTNDGDGSIYIKQPHNSDSFAGVAPQGPLVVAGSRLLIPGGRSVPACYDRGTGRLLYYQLADNSKRGGGWAVSEHDGVFFNGGAAFSTVTGQYLGAIGDLVTVEGDRIFDYADGELRTLDATPPVVTLETKPNPKGPPTVNAKWSLKELSTAEAGKLSALLKAGSRLYGGGAGRITAFELPVPKSGDVDSAWEIAVDGTVVHLTAADDKLLATTREGTIYCFGPATTAPATPLQHAFAPPAVPSQPTWNAKAEELLKCTHAHQGYALLWGAGEGELAAALTQRSELRCVVIEPDAAKVTDLRQRWGKQGVGADRLAILRADPKDVLLPPYFAELICAESMPEFARSDRPAFLEKTFAALRPYGGKACLPIPVEERATYASATQNASPPTTTFANAAWRQAGDWALLVREGALPGAADWTHEHADAANTRVSKDKLVKAPLGLLWFGGASHEGILPRHGHGPQPQVVDGRLFIEGVDMLRAMDIYTGRVLWEASLPGVGAFYNNAAHQPGANSRGTNLIATGDGIYIAYKETCLRLDPATGKRTSEFKLPPVKDADESPAWGYINVYQDLLIGGADPLFDPAVVKKNDNDNYSSSGRLIVMNRLTGEHLWSVDARSGFRHNAVCIGGGRMYCIDRLPASEAARLARRGEAAPHKPRLVAFDLKTGSEVWSADEDIFGTWLSYSEERDALVEAGRQARDTLSDEPKGMRVYQGRDGVLLWESKTYAGPAMIHHDTILMAGTACELLTGERKMRQHPLSGESMEWLWSRNYGCNTPAASEHLITFRSGAAGFFDFCNDGGTGNLGGFRSSCTHNLVVAGGILSAPDYTRSCSCSYQNQTSLALIHMPEAEQWTSFGAQTPKQPVRRVGINLAAPGDRKGDDGALWLEFPSVGGASPTLDIKIKPEQPEWFRRHSSQFSGSGPAWVASSGAKGITSLEIDLECSKRDPRKYTVRLFFAEPDDVEIGERLFDVEVQGRKVLTSFDVLKEAGGRNRGLVKEFQGVMVGDDLEIELMPTRGAKEPAAVLSGVEVQAEGW